MDKLYYFAPLALMLRIWHNSDHNSIHFSSHRLLSEKEIRRVEQYIMDKVLPSLDHPMMTRDLIYKGQDESLREELRFYRLQGTIREVISKKQIVDDQVRDLINRSLSNYYFEKLGEKLICLRRALNQNARDHHIDQLIKDVQILLEAYNVNSGQRLELDQILPREAKFKIH